jgi:hypothetical protein
MQNHFSLIKFPVVNILSTIEQKVELGSGDSMIVPDRHLKLGNYEYVMQGFRRDKSMGMVFGLEKNSVMEYHR